ncbi:hypothetical protein DFH08DRAFT_320111 [Mycena albidolilacea]|uniref:Uncharacterized protein n=1 Tax=Mycena albidolilacea TaxID=1033008 RepID=A0AAD7EK98_9AGAR|nr:hypothetical protein DFH08DRAFT_320111 [Mycena albidolilacea]
MRCPRSPCPASPSGPSPSCVCSPTLAHHGVHHPRRAAAHAPAHGPAIPIPKMSNAIWLIKRIQRVLRGGAAPAGVDDEVLLAATRCLLGWEVLEIWYHNAIWRVSQCYGMWGACGARERGVGGNGVWAAMCATPCTFFRSGTTGCEVQGGRNVDCTWATMHGGMDAAVLSLVHVSLRLPPARLRPYFPASQERELRALGPRQRGGVGFKRVTLAWKSLDDGMSDGRKEARRVEVLHVGRKRALQTTTTTPIPSSAVWSATSAFCAMVSNSTAPKLMKHRSTQQNLFEHERTCCRLLIRSLFNHISFIF